MPDVSLAQIAQALIVATLVGVVKTLWTVLTSFERLKVWAENHEKLDDIRFNALAHELELRRLEAMDSGRIPRTH